MLKTLTLCALVMLVTLGCKKDKKEDTSTCALAMKEKFKAELVCEPSTDFRQVKLFKGNYKGKVVYFTNIICPNCNNAPPTYGYTCEEEKVTFEKFTDVKDIKAIYDSCTDSFSE